jgi:hypothetical protein
MYDMFFLMCCLLIVFLIICWQWTHATYLNSCDLSNITHPITKGWDPLKIKIQATDVRIPQQEQNTTLRHTSHHTGMGPNTDQDIRSRYLYATVWQLNIKHNEL